MFLFGHSGAGPSGRHPSCLHNQRAGHGAGGGGADTETPRRAESGFSLPRWSPRPGAARSHPRRPGFRPGVEMGRRERARVPLVPPAW